MLPVGHFLKRAEIDALRNINQKIHESRAFVDDEKIDFLINGQLKLPGGIEKTSS